MQRFNRSLYTFLSLLALCGPLLAQAPLPPGRRVAAIRSTQPLPPGVQGSVASRSVNPDWFDQLINLDIRNATLTDAVKRIMDSVKVKVERVDDLTKSESSRLSLRLQKVNARDAMASVARLYGAQAYVLNDNGKVTIELRKRTETISATGRTVLPALPFTSADSVGPLGQSKLFVTRNTERYKDLPDKKITLQSDQSTPQELLKQIAEQAAIEYDVEEGLKSDAKLNLKLENAPLGSALDMVAGWLRCGWKAEKTGDKVKVSFSKKYPSNSYAFTTGRGGPAVSIPVIPDMPAVTGLFRAPLPDKRVSLDKRNEDVRVCFKDVLTQAGLSYVLADDLPMEMKSFTFDNVPITTALNTLCESIGVGWMAERGPDGKPIVQVSKRYWGRRTSSSQESYPFSHYIPALPNGNQSYNGTLPPATSVYGRSLLEADRMLQERLERYNPVHRIPIDLLLQ